ncbi:MAG: DUF1499 domain-containing protein [Kiloniellales bacterium]|nr:DUF1499 domain-containing protein [Kiloniellales bacterium]
MARRRGPSAITTGLLVAVGLLTGCAANTEPQDLRELRRSDSPNDSLACPPGICTAETDFQSPVFGTSPEAVLQALREAVEDQPRTELAAEVPEPEQVIYVQRSAVFRFPDTVWIQPVVLPEGSSVIIYSRSNYGYSDFGVNRERVGLWIGLLRAALAADLVR